MNWLSKKWFFKQLSEYKYDKYHTDLIVNDNNSNTVILYCLLQVQIMQTLFYSPLMIRLACIPCSFYKTLYDLQILHKGTVADHLNPQNSTEYVSAKCQHVPWYQITNKATLKGGIGYVVFSSTHFLKKFWLIGKPWTFCKLWLRQMLVNCNKLRHSHWYVTHYDTYKVYLHIFQTHTTPKIIHSLVWIKAIYSR